MSNDSYAINVDTGYVDEDGKSLLWSNDVLSVFYYNATASGTEENWVKSWDYINPVANYNFDASTSGVGWTLDTDDSTEPYTTYLCLYADWNNTDLLRDQSITSSGDVFPYEVEDLVDIYETNGWRTDGAGVDGAYAATVDMGESKDISHTWFIPGFGSGDTNYSAAVKDYRIGISDTGGENDFTVVASGTTSSGVYHPVINFIGNQNTRYLKFYIDSNWGHASYHQVGKLSAFYEPDWSLHGFCDGYHTGEGSYAVWKQDVDLTGIDALFVDVRARFNSAYQNGEMEILVDNDSLRSYDYSSTSSWLEDKFWTRREEELDVSSYSGTHPLKLNIFHDSSAGKYAFMGYFDNVAVNPAWYTEEHGLYRGNISSFPDEVYIVSDREGLSIIDKTYFKLWMRFMVGPGYALESAARDVVADEGCIYLATSQGLVIIDFTQNRVWKYTENGVYYKMSIAKRNSSQYWFEETTSESLSCNDVYAVSLGSYGGDGFVVAGHSYGMSYIKEPVAATKAVNNSTFTYPVHKIYAHNDDSGITQRIVYVGGYDNRSRLGVMEDISSIQAGDFDDSTIMYHSDAMHNDGFSGSFSDQWVSSDGNLGWGFDSSYTTISGVKNDYGNTLLIQKDLSPDRPFRAEMEVKIDKWPERTNGGLHFGVTSGWPVVPILYEVSSHALMLSAVNGTDGVFVEDEKFNTFPNKNNWQLSIYSQEDTEVSTESDAFKIRSSLSAPSGGDNAYGRILGSVRALSAADFTAKVKVKCTELDKSDSDLRQNCVVFGISDGSYVGGGSGTNILGMGIYSHLSNADPPVYAVNYTTASNKLYWDTSDSASLFTGDRAESASWHQWEFTYTASSKTINAAVDGVYVGSYTLAGMGSDIGIIMGVTGNGIGDYATAYFKDFEIDFGVLPDYAKKEYIAQTYDDGAYSLPTVSGSHLDGLPFSVNDGTYSSGWRKWEIDYDMSTLMGYIDGMQAGPVVDLGLGNNNQRLFVYYNHPATASGSLDDRDVDIKIRNFSVEYTGDTTVVSGLLNSFWFEPGSYLGADYNTLYLATSSGVHIARYESSTSVSGTPENEWLYSADGFGHNILYGNINNISSVEPSSGAAGQTGLLYAGSSRYYPRGWERLIDRVGSELSDHNVSVSCSPEGNALYLSTSVDNDVFLYELDTGVISFSWAKFLHSDHPKDFADTSYADRVYVWDMQDGNLYCCSVYWVGIYSKNSSKWIHADENIGTPLVGSYGYFSEWEGAPLHVRKGVFLLYYGIPLYMPVKERQWIVNYRHNEDRWWSESSACVYSDVDDAVYALKQGSSGNFYRMPMSTLVFSGPLSDCPLPYDFSNGISAFYRPYDECLYFVFRGSTQSYGRKFVKYDVKLDEWSFWGEDFPSQVYDFMVAVYAFEEDAVYMIAGSESSKVYKYYFPIDVTPRFVSWSASEGLLPEDSMLARFRKIDFNTEYGNKSDSFNDSSVGQPWYQNTDEWATGGITEGDEYLSIVCGYDSPSANFNIVRSIPVPACGFSASADIRVNDMARSTGEGAGSRNTFLFGITGFLGSPGSRADTNDIEMGLSMVSLDGLFMTAINDSSDDNNKYSLYKAENGSDTFYSTSLYEDFSASDATRSADFKEWRIDYTRTSNQLEAFLDGTSIGTASLSDEGFLHGGSLYIGSQRWGTAVSGSVDVDIKNLSVSVDSSSSLVSNYLELNDADEYGYTHYEKFDATLISGSCLTYECDWRVETYAATDNVYITGLGGIEDGNKEIVLSALYTGDKEVGIYTGGDPRELSSYSSFECDWQTRKTYKMVSDNGGVDVFVDGEMTPSLSVNYDSLPDTDYRRCRFGSFNPDNTEYVWSRRRNGQYVTVSGAWAEASSESSYYGRNYTMYSNSVDDKAIVRFNHIVGGYLYVFYSAGSSRSQSVPFTVYHEGVLDLLVSDSYATNPIVSVSDNVDEYGNTDLDATTVVVNQERFSDGSYYDRLPTGAGSGRPSGWVYLGKFDNISRVVVTCSSSGGTASDLVDFDSMLLKCTDTQPRARSVSRIYSVGYTLGKNSQVYNSDYQGGFSVVDLSSSTLLNGYSDVSETQILSGNISDFDVL